MALIGAIFTTIGAVQQHQQENANLEAQAQQHEYNRRLEEREARTVEAETLENAKRQRAENDRFRSAQRAAMGKSGAALASGSPLALLGETAADQEQSVLDAQRTGYRQSQQHVESAKNHQYRANAARASKRSGSQLGLELAGTWTNALVEDVDRALKIL